jgi:tRNA (cytidine32/uridine32-2'-O)-methyltransferase
MSSKGLERYKVLLVGTKVPGNIGATARLLENFAVGEGALVSPRCEWKSGMDRWVATGTSRARLDSLPVFSSLKEAVSDCHAVVGFTARAGKTRKLSLKIETLSSLLPGKVALVFGREDFCLLKEEIEVCTHLCALDTGDSFPALNLSHSVAVVLSRLFQEENQSRRGHHRIATGGELEPLFEHLSESLESLGYTGEGNPGRVLMKLKKIYQRAGLTRPEVDLLRGICSRIISGPSRKRGLAPD